MSDPAPGLRIAIGVEYDGTRYSGWQRQPGVPSVQAEIERALGRVADHPVSVTCGGRTDAGVHAIGQVAHFDTTAARSTRGWVLGANTHLPPDIALTWAVPAAPGFHARHSALSRSYRYVIQNRAVRPGLFSGRMSWVRDPLDAQAMHDAAQCLVGDHDFSAFRAAECQSRTAQRRLHSIAVWREAGQVIVEVTANAFLHHMVRNIVGTLLPVGRGLQPPESVAAALASRDRTAAGVTAEAAGLYLLAIRYPAGTGLPDAASPPASAMIPGAWPQRDPP